MERPSSIPFTAELQRKAIHLLALVLPAGILWLGRRDAAIALGVLMLAAVAADVARQRVRWFHRLILRLFGFMMRVEELPPFGGPVSLNGASWVLISCFFTTLLFPAEISAAAIAMFMIADAAAAIVGRRYGRIRWGPHGRTVEGSLAFVVAGLAVMLVLPGIALPAAVVGVLVGAAAEAVPRPFNDNLRVPLSTGLAIFAVERLIG